jgi:hypothetical protein
VPESISFDAVSALSWICHADRPHPSHIRSAIVRLRTIPVVIGVLVAAFAAPVQPASAQSNGAAKAAPQATPKPAQSAHDFVDRFYDRYLSEIVDDDNLPSPYDALQIEPRVFSPGLRKALRDDFDAQDASPDEIVGLDFDPFLNSQDPCDEYEVGRATLHGSTYWVAVYGICDGKKHSQPDLYAEVAPVKASWQFVNFHYPDGGNLLGRLKSLSAERRKAPKDTPGMTKS